jgi:signal transduction histidine kinase
MPTLAEQLERRRLADLLHDHLQQLLAGARLNLEVVQKKRSSQDSDLNSAYDLVSQSLDTSRTLSAERSPPILYMHGLAEALHWLARWMEKTHKLQVDCMPRPTPRRSRKILLFGGYSVHSRGIDILRKMAETQCNPGDPPTNTNKKHPK